LKLVYDNKLLEYIDAKYEKPIPVEKPTEKEPKKSSYKPSGKFLHGIYD
jgi:hypothetical protein